MPKTFADYAEAWVFCGYRILSYKWERAVVLARAPAEIKTLDRMADKLREEMINEMLKEGRRMAEVDAIVKQTNDIRYAGEVIDGRFQVMESWISGSYYLVDHARDDLLVRIAGPGSDTKRFPTIDAAEAFIKEFTPPLPRGSRWGSAPADVQPQETDDMARPATKGSIAALKSADAADKAIGAKAPKTTKAAKVAAVATPPAKAVKAAKAQPAALAKAREAKGPTAAAMFRELLMADGKTQKLTDDQIFAKVQEAFGLDDGKRTYVAWYRKDLQKKGQTPPPAKA